ncbi:hypothetical protein B0T20DRAFT_389217 [Sordaria brevicollis]|uniref:Uncharacterized protein n=1 Tax=Sordaria brevicollis TaxID=83679 RepID=A0AAE0PPF7_SORBR|nr:hypothetical protein B0T20DRAFT_389217 [Sordaria brevicollis]
MSLLIHNMIILFSSTFQLAQAEKNRHHDLRQRSSVMKHSVHNVVFASSVCSRGAARVTVIYTIMFVKRHISLLPSWRLRENVRWTVVETSVKNSVSMVDNSPMVNHSVGFVNRSFGQSVFSRPICGGRQISGGIKREKQCKRCSGRKCCENVCVSFNGRLQASCYGKNALSSQPQRPGVSGRCLGTKGDVEDCPMTGNGKRSPGEDSISVESQPRQEMKVSEEMLPATSRPTQLPTTTAGSECASCISEIVNIALWTGTWRLPRRL